MDGRMDSLDEIRGLAPDAVQMMGDMLHNSKVPAMVKVRIRIFMLHACL